MRSREPGRGVKQGRLLLAGALVLLAALASYEGVRHNDFVDFDDTVYVRDFPLYRAPFGPGTLASAVTLENGAPYWQPVTLVSLALDHALFGPSPRAIHLENVGWHASTSILVLLLLVSLTGQLARSTAAAVLFAAHPVAVESVAWAVERRMVLAGFLGLLTLLAYVRWVRRGRAPWYAASLLAFVASLSAKPALLALPAVLLAIDFWPLRRTGLRRCLVEKIPFAVVSVAIAALVSHTLGENPPGPALALKAANAVVIPFRYLASLAWPAHLSVFYPYPVHLPAWQPALAVAGLAAVTGAFLALRRPAPYLIVGWAWFLLGLLPTLGFKQRGYWAALADRHVYVAALGLYVAAVWGAADLIDKVRRTTPVAKATGAAIAAVLLILVTRQQVATWRNTIALFERAREVAGEPEVHIEYMLGKALLDAGRKPDGEAHLRIALELVPNQFEPLRELGRSRVGAADAEAALLLSRALRLRPDHGLTRSTLAGCLLRLGRPAEAVELFRQAPPVNAEGLYYLTLAHAALGQVDLARAEGARLPPELRGSMERALTEKKGGR